MHLHLTINKDLVAYIKLLDYPELHLDLLRIPLAHIKDAIEIDFNIPRVRVGCV